MDNNALKFSFKVDGDDFTSAGRASVQIKKNLRELGISPDIIRKVSIAMYEGEINMVIHAGGGEADVSFQTTALLLFSPTTGLAFQTLIWQCRKDIPPHPTTSVHSDSAQEWGFLI